MHLTLELRALPVVRRAQLGLAHHLLVAHPSGNGQVGSAVRAPRRVLDHRVARVVRPRRLELLELGAQPVVLLLELRKAVAAAERVVGLLELAHARRGRRRRRLRPRPALPLRRPRAIALALGAG